jgi:hypothetical protein
MRFHAGRSWVRVQIKTPSISTMLWGSSASNRNEYRRLQLCTTVGTVTAAHYRWGSYCCALPLGQLLLRTFRAFTAAHCRWGSYCCALPLGQLLLRTFRAFTAAHYRWGSYCCAPFGHLILRTAVGAIMRSTAVGALTAVQCHWSLYC